MLSPYASSGPYTYFDSSIDKEVIGPSHYLSDISNLALAQTKEKIYANLELSKPLNEEAPTSTTLEVDQPPPNIEFFEKELVSIFLFSLCTYFFTFFCF